MNYWDQVKQKAVDDNRYLLQLSQSYIYLDLKDGTTYKTAEQVQNEIQCIENSKQSILLLQHDMEEELEKIKTKSEGINWNKVMTGLLAVAIASQMKQVSHVKSYRRKDGTYVKGYSRKVPVELIPDFSQLSDDSKSPKEIAIEMYAQNIQSAKQLTQLCDTSINLGQQYLKNPKAYIWLQEKRSVPSKRTTKKVKKHKKIVLPSYPIMIWLGLSFIQAVYLVYNYGDFPPFTANTLVQFAVCFVFSVCSVFAVAMAIFMAIALIKIFWQSM
jgi:hypothetical protein